MNKIKALSNNWQSYYPVFAWCYNYGTDWYLPATAELIAILDNQSAINSTLSAKDYATLDDGSGGNGYTGWWPYWTSTQCGTEAAHCMTMDYYPHDKYIGDVTRAKKTFNCLVRAIFAW